MNFTASLLRYASRRCFVLVGCLSVFATVVIFVYSMSLDDQNKTNKVLLLMKMRKSNHDHLAKLRARANRFAAIQHPVAKAFKWQPYRNDSANHIPPRSGVIQGLKISWPDKGKKDKLNMAPHKHHFDFMQTPVKNVLDVPRIAEYCNLPIKELHGKEGEAPAGYSLKSVYVVIRHGDRSPMGGTKIAPILNCQYNATSSFDIPYYNKFVSTLQSFKSKLHKSNNFMFPLYPNSEICENAQMTSNGVHQHLLNGWLLHERYVKKWRLFSEPFSPEQVYAKSTGYSRTYQSAVAFLYTFLPRFNLTDLNIFRSENTFFCSEKSLRQPCSCPMLSKLKKLSDKDIAAVLNNTTKLNKLRYYIASVFNMKPHKLPGAFDLLDKLMAYACHKIPLPCNAKHDCIDSSHLAELWRYLDIRSSELARLDYFRKYSHLGIHPLLHEMSQHMILTTKRKAKVKFVLYSGHDVTVTPLVTALGINQGRWPMYGTRVVFELYSKVGPKTHHFLRILFNGEDVTSKVSFCTGLVKNGFCKLKYFIDFIEKGNLALFNGKTYKEACNIS